MRRRAEASRGKGLLAPDADGEQYPQGLLAQGIERGPGVRGGHDGGDHDALGMAGGARQDLAYVAGLASKQRNGDSVVH